MTIDLSLASQKARCPRHRCFQPGSFLLTASAITVAVALLATSAHAAPISEALPIPPAFSAAQTSASSTSATSTRLVVPTPLELARETPAFDTRDLKYVSLASDFRSQSSSSERNTILLRLNEIAGFLAVRDTKALDVFKLDIKASSSAPRVSFVLTNLATSLRGALARVQVTFESPIITKAVATKGIATKATSTRSLKTAASRVDFQYDVWFARTDDGTFQLGKAWRLAGDAAAELSADALRLWRETTPKRLSPVAPPADNNSNRLTSTNVSALMSPSVAVNKGGDLLTLVAEYRGGHWVALRANSSWQGAILDASNLARAATRMQTTAQTPMQNSLSATSSTRSDKDASEVRFSNDDSAFSPLEFSSAASSDAKNLRLTNDSNEWIASWLRSQMSRYQRRTAGTAHFVFQRSALGWVGIDSVFESAKEAGDAAYGRLDDLARRSRADISGDDFALAQAHFNYAQALFGVKLFNEAGDELDKAAAMSPDLVSADMNATFDNARREDVQNRVDAQRDLATQIGLSREHPQRTVPDLQRQFRQTPNPLTALRISLEYSRLAYEREAMTWYNYAMQGAASFVSTANVPDRAWVNVLRDQLKTRFDLSSTKPGNIIRSDLFTVRCTLNDRNIVQLLAGLEASQYTIYSRFGVPMGNTEVIMWSSQNQFQAYTSRQAGRNTSEFVTALTLTQLVNANDGPVVLGEEINFFADARASSISTIAHEYGHIAVRNMAKGREVPDWLNEGIATFVEGGYENYQVRVRNARSRGSLLSMRDLQIWNVDGERAFLAYSQANSMIDFIVDSKNPNWGGNAVLEILKQIGADVPPNDAFKKVLRVDPTRFYIMWLNSLAQQEAARRKKGS